MSKAFNQYDVVRVLGFGVGADLTLSEFYERPPRVGDTATIVEIYDNPPGYELECCDGHSGGATTWLRSFRVTEIKLELLKSQMSGSDNKD
jgi:hypothetical protein